MDKKKLPKGKCQFLDLIARASRASLRRLDRKLRLNSIQQGDLIYDKKLNEWFDYDDRRYGPIINSYLNRMSSSDHKDRFFKVMNG